MMATETPRPVTVGTTCRRCGPDRVLPVTLWWDPAAPHEVGLEFHALGTSVGWVLDRELLASGLILSAGDGDVRVEPFAGDLLLHLASPDGTATCLFDGDTIGRFLADTYRQVPLGEEQIVVPEPEYFGAPTGDAR